MWRTGLGGSCGVLSGRAVVACTDRSAEPRVGCVGQVAGTTLKRIHLAYTDGLVQLRMWPGDTLEQAQPLYAQPGLLGACDRLDASGWSIHPNFHWGFIETGYLHRDNMPGTVSVREYIEYWMEHASSARELKPHEYDE